MEPRSPPMEQSFSELRPLFCKTREATSRREIFRGKKSCRESRAESKCTAVDQDEAAGYVELGVCFCLLGCGFEVFVSRFETAARAAAKFRPLTNASFMIGSESGPAHFSLGQSILAICPWQSGPLRGNSGAAVCPTVDRQ